MTWVKFETVRENLDFAEVLAYFVFRTVLLHETLLSYNNLPRSP